MIWKSVSTSRKVNKLSLKAALLWTWCIPHFDVAGYLEVEPDDLKYKVVQRRNDIKEEEIEKLVDEIILSGLWLRCQTNNNTKVVFDPKFCDMQQVREDREAQSKWKGQCEIIEITPDELQKNSSTTPRALPPKLGKVKLNKSSIREFVTISKDDLKKLSHLFKNEELEWMLNKLNFWVGNKEKPKIVNGYGYFRKGSWLIEEMEKHFNLSPKDSGKCEKCGKSEKYRGGLCVECFLNKGSN